MGICGSQKNSSLNDEKYEYKAPPKASSLSPRNINDINIDKNMSQFNDFCDKFCPFQCALNNDSKLVKWFIRI